VQASESGGRLTLRRLLRERDLRLLLGSQFLAQAADGLGQAIFADVLVLEPLNQGTPSRILALFAITLLPYSLIAPFLGVFVDRWPRRALLSWTNVIRGLLLVSLPLWDQAFPGRIALYVAVLCMLGLGRLFLTTKGATLPVLLHEHQLLRGNAFSSGGGMVSALLGGIAGIAASAALGSAFGFALTGALYLGAAALAATISQPFSHPHARSERATDALGRIASELGEGVVAIWRRTTARVPLAAIFVLRVAGMLVAIAAILVTKNEFSTESEHVGRLSSSALALGGAGLGAFAGAITSPLYARRLAKPGLVVLGFALSGTAIVVLGGVADMRAVVGLTFFGGYGGFLSKVAVDAQLQEALPDEFRGRGFAIYDILYNLASVVAAALMVSIGGSSLRVAMLIAGVVTLGLSAAVAFALKSAGLPLRRDAGPGGARVVEH
jgi:MFS family permease